MTVRAGLIGFGLAGRYLHAPLMAAAGFEIAAAVTSRTDALNADFPAAEALADAEALSARNDVELIVVASPSHLHVEQARAALQAGKHVVIDKPFAATTADALALIETAEAKRRVLSVFHNRRWDADFLTLRRVLKEETLGEPVYYDARWDRYRPQLRGGWREEALPAAGVLYDLGAHLIDQALMLFGAPDWLQADVSAQRGGPADDWFQILMGKGRLRIGLAASVFAADAARVTRVLGAGGAYRKEGLDPQEAQLGARHAPIPADLGAEDEAAAATITDGASGAVRRIPSERGDWLAFYRGMRAAIETGAPPPVSPLEAARVIGVIEACFAGVRTGRRVDLAAFLASKGL